MMIRLRWRLRRSGLERRFLRRASYFFFAVAALTFGIGALFYFEALLSGAKDRRDFEELRHAAIPSRQKFPSSPARLEIPRLDISVMVYEGVSAATLRRGAGHIPGTAMIGDDGNIGIAAHRDSFFRPLRDIKPKDTIWLETIEGSYQYAVEWTNVVSASDVGVLEASDGSVLTLVTCYPFYYVGAAPDRFIVRARRLGMTR
jgi:sortase A